MLKEILEHLPKSGDGDGEADKDSDMIRDDPGEVDGEHGLVDDQDGVCMDIDED